MTTCQHKPVTIFFGQLLTISECYSQNSDNFLSLSIYIYVCIRVLICTVCSVSQILDQVQNIHVFVKLSKIIRGLGSFFTFKINFLNHLWASGLLTNITALLILESK